MKSTTNINIEGIEPHGEIMKALKNFKQGSLLESNFVRVQYILTDEIIEHLSDLDAQEISKREMIQKLSRELVEKYKEDFEEERVPYGKRFSLSMLVMSTKELKHIVEYCIRTMPQSAIEEIRN